MGYMSFNYYLSLMSMALGGRNSGMFLTVNGSPVSGCNIHTIRPTLETLIVYYRSAFLIFNRRIIPL